MKENFSKSLQKALQFLLPLQRNILELGLGESIEILYSIFKIYRRKRFKINEHRI